ncbi:DUF3616 domain-containing protein [Microcoleus sp. FACHB-672]|uniref:DUF3616 domain-containing protein n=1 Tax=Microcoleus sp. FACHB-672 TaxID=2692825 RepID=UPI0016831484|nr:DUF3616 domain-containing protein [Microcoleus sp. FACHB-672]MBD2041879.1 DUF3616 domain-containing protein [Microcoleus sp. FACHB-672]
MAEGFLLSRVLLRFAPEFTDIIGDLSAAALTPDGSLWVASDETTSIERLSQIEPCIFGEHKRFAIGDFIELFNEKDEIDIEGMDYTNHYLWFIGSHSTKRKKTKGNEPEQDIQRLAEVKTELNRYLLGRIPVFDKQLFKSCSHPENPEQKLTAGCLQKTDSLLTILENDSHLGSFIAAGIPSKENGFDIEGLAVRGDKVFIGLRGPVLRGWAIILEIEIEEPNPGILALKAIGSEGERYKKHFVQMNGLGVRELCIDGEDLIILAGPTMELEGNLRVFRLKNALELSGNTLFSQDSGHLEVLFDLPFILGADHAEGLALFPCLGQPNSLLVVYDSPDAPRKVEKDAVFADVFKLKR